MGERGKGSQVSGGRSEWVLRARSLLSRVFVSCSCADFDQIGSRWVNWSVPFMGHPAFPFIGQGKAWVTAEEKEKNERERER